MKTSTKQSSISHFVKTTYFGYLDFSQEAVTEREIEDSLLAFTGTPELSEYGLESRPLIEGWWYTGVNEERLDQIIDFLTSSVPEPKITM